MTATRLAPARALDVPYATTVVIADLLPGTHAYCDLHKNAQPILVIVTGPTEIQPSLPGDIITLGRPAAHRQHHGGPGRFSAPRWSPTSSERGG